MSVVCVSYLDNCSRAANNLSHFDITFPQYYQLMLPCIVLHHIAPIHCENTANTTNVVLCHSFAVIFGVDMFESMYIL